MYFRLSSVWLGSCTTTIASLLVANLSYASPCPSTPEDAARSFVQLGVEDPASSVHVLDSRSLSQYRSRFEQLLNDRYSPMSSAFREKMFGKEMTTARLTTLSDAELIGRYFAAGQKVRGPSSVDGITLLSKRTDRYFGEEVSIRYHVKTPTGESVQERKFSVSNSSGCWRLDVPIEAWARLGQLSKIFKESRPDLGLNREGPSVVTLRVAAARGTAQEDMREMKQRGRDRTNVWVSTVPIVTESDVVGASASWDCESVLGPEDPSVWIRFNDRAGHALKTWSEKNIGSMLAIAADGEVITYAKVAGVLGNKLSMCLPGEGLDDAEALANALRGAKK